MDWDEAIMRIIVWCHLSSLLAVWRMLHRDGMDDRVQMPLSTGWTGFVTLHLLSATVVLYFHSLIVASPGFDLVHGIVLYCTALYHVCLSPAKKIAYLYADHGRHGKDNSSIAPRVQGDIGRFKEGGKVANSSIIPVSITLLQITATVLYGLYWCDGAALPSSFPLITTFTRYLLLLDLCIYSRRARDMVWTRPY